MRLSRRRPRRSDSARSWKHASTSPVVREYEQWPGKTPTRRIKKEIIDLNDE
jgi:hypothetical protein